MARRETYKQRLKRVRQDRVERRAGGKDLIHDEDTMIELLAAKAVPVMVQHCVLKVVRKTKGSPKDRYLAAFNICSAVFQNNGYMKRGSMSMTGKGLKRNRMHQREKEAASKKGRFKSLTDQLYGKEMDQIKEDNKEDKQAKE